MEFKEGQYVTAIKVFNQSRVDIYRIKNKAIQILKKTKSVVSSVALEKERSIEFRNADKLFKLRLQKKKEMRIY